MSSFVNIAAEYYGVWGTLQAMYPWSQQQQQLFAAVNLNFGPAWEFNFGLGEGFTPNTDHLIVKNDPGAARPMRPAAGLCVWFRPVSTYLISYSLAAQRRPT